MQQKQSGKGLQVFYIQFCIIIVTVLCHTIGFSGEQFLSFFTLTKSV